ncbi:MAG: GTP cyclohydrolase I [Oscillospiraceae bacterium]|jgi:GTP cyclohydrolase I|nr:GTP cyclohydrolase I [Oscillospiraceae bacterium]
MRNNKNIDIISAQEAVKKLFNSLSITLTNETPERFVNMIRDFTQYQNVSNKEIAKSVQKTFKIDNYTKSKNMVLTKNIETFSLCEHHIALMYNMKISIAYVPQNFVLGLSKIVRAVGMICKRLQLQEKIGNDIIEVMSILTKSLDVAVHIKAKHSCITARGANNFPTETITTNFAGIFSQDNTTKKLFLNSVSTD